MRREPLTLPPDTASKAVTRIGRNTIFLATSDIALKFFIFLFFIIVARNLGPEQFGIFSFATGFVMLFLILTDLGISQLIVREVARDYSLINSEVKSSFSLKFILSFLTVVLILILAKILKYSDSTIKIVAIIAIFMVFNSQWLFLNAVFQALEKMYLIGLSRLLYGTLLLIGALVVVVFKLKIVGFSFAYLISIALAFVLNYLIFEYKYSDLKPTIDVKRWIAILKKAIPFGLTSIFATFYYWNGMSLLSIMKGNQMVGWYNAAFRLVLGLTFIPIAFSEAVYPLISRYFSKSQSELIKITLFRIMKYMFLIALPLAIIGTIYGKQIITLFYGSDYTAAGLALSMLIWWLFFLYLNNIQVTTVFAVNIPHIVSIQAGIAAIINLLLNLILISKFDLIGIGIALIVAESFSFFFLVIHLRKHRYFFSLQDYLQTFVKSICAALILVGIIILLPIRFVIYKVIIAIIFYFISLLILKVLDKSDYRIIKQVFSLQK